MNPAPGLNAVVFARNEAGNIGPLVQALLGECPRVLASLRVVAEGCADNTAALARQAADEDDRFALEEFAAASGKWAAMRRHLCGLQQPSPAPPQLLLSADVLPQPGALALLQQALTAMPGGQPVAVGGRVVPLNEPKGFGRVVHVLWALHHVAARLRPRAGEAIVLWGIPPTLPQTVVADEPALCELTRQQGGAVIYEPQAIFFNLGPDNVREYLARRRSIAGGFLQLRRMGLCPRYRFGQWWPLATTLARWLLLGTPVGRWPVASACGLEALSRFLGWLDERTGRLSPQWPAAPSTKTLPTEPSRQKQAMGIQNGFEKQGKSPFTHGRG